MSTSKDSLEFIAYENGLELIETTSERNGYPANLKYAIIGFNSFEEAEKIAKDNNLSIEIFTKNDGWQLYYRTGNRVHEPLRMAQIITEIFILNSAAKTWIPFMKRR